LATSSNRPRDPSWPTPCALPPRNETYLNPKLGAQVAAAPPAPQGPPDGLTAREAEILRLIALGHTNTEIAGVPASPRVPQSPRPRSPPPREVRAYSTQPH